MLKPHLPPSNHLCVPPDALLPDPLPTSEDFTIELCTAPPSMYLLHSIWCFFKFNLILWHSYLFEIVLYLKMIERTLLPPSYVADFVKQSEYKYIREGNHEKNKSDTLRCLQLSEVDSKYR
jgi:hypothetical protein